MSCLNAQVSPAADWEDYQIEDDGRAVAWPCLAIASPSTAFC